GVKIARRSTPAERRAPRGRDWDACLETSPRGARGRELEQWAHRPWSVFGRSAGSCRAIEVSALCEQVAHVCPRCGRRGGPCSALRAALMCSQKRSGGTGLHLLWRRGSQTYLQVARSPARSVAFARNRDISTAACHELEDNCSRTRRRTRQGGCVEYR